MIRNVLSGYLEQLKEREFDLPFSSLLPELGFYDIHFTHGNVEFGKDFIAKRRDEDAIFQYSFQLKAGDIGQAEWRNNIMGQMLECVLNGLSHPNFDRNLPYKSVLVTTGRLLGNAALSVQELNNTIENTFRRLPIVVWDKEPLLDKLETHGLGGVHRATASGYVGYGNFYVSYGQSLQGKLSEWNIERHLRSWLYEDSGTIKRLLGTTIESEILAGQLRSQGLYYEAIHCTFNTIRAALYMLQVLIEENQGGANLEVSLAVYEQARSSLYIRCREYVDEFQQQWKDHERNLVKAMASPSLIGYLVQCARVLEISGCLYFLEPNDEVRADLIAFLAEFVTQEPGTARVPSDRYAVSPVLATLALINSGQQDIAKDLLRRCALWLCDRFTSGNGIAPIFSDPYVEVTTLFGSAFEFVTQATRSASLLATVLSDLAAFLGDQQFYQDLTNDITACSIFRSYWQIVDSPEMFKREGTDVIFYPNIEYRDALTSFDLFDFAEHIRSESHSYRILEHISASGLMPIMLLLRDRYFPSLWSQLAAENQVGGSQG